LKAVSEVLQGKEYVGIYFSAHWCPPCRGFTPQLATSYEEHLKAKGLEIVFVSSDRDEKSFDEYYAEMPWVALPYSESTCKEALNKKFKVGGIPTLVILDSEGKLVTKDARKGVGKDPTGEEFPWKPKPMSEVLSALTSKMTVQNKDGKSLPFDSLKGKVVGLYFSAHWCPPCKMFTPKLAEQYKKIKDAGHDFEIVFVSSDRDESAFDSYYSEMPWLVLPYSDRDSKNALSECFGVSGIPSLVLLDRDQSVITLNGRGAVMQDVAEFPFHEKPVKDITSDTDGLNETTCVVVLADKATQEDQDKAHAALEPLATEYKTAAKASNDDPEFLFFLARSSEGPVSQIRNLCGLSSESAAPQLILLDIPDNGGFYAAKDVELTSEGIRGWLSDYKSEKLERQQLKG